MLRNRSRKMIDGIDLRPPTARGTTSGGPGTSRLRRFFRIVAARCESLSSTQWRFAEVSDYEPVSACRIRISPNACAPFESIRHLHEDKSALGAQHGTGVEQKSRRLLFRWNSAFMKPCPSPPWSRHLAATTPGRERSGPRLCRHQLVLSRGYFQQTIDAKQLADEFYNLLDPKNLRSSQCEHKGRTPHLHRSKWPRATFRSARASQRRARSGFICRCNLPQTSTPGESPPARLRRRTAHAHHCRKCCSHRRAVRLLRALGGNPPGYSQ